MGAVFLFVISVLTESQYTFLYLMGKPFNWTPVGVGLYSALGSVALGGSTLLILLITYRFMVPPASATRICNPSVHSSTSSPCDSPLPAGSSPPDEEYNSEKGVARIEHELLRSRLHMLTYLLSSYLATALSKLVMAIGPWIPAPHCSIIPYVALVISLSRAALIPTLKAFLSSLYPTALQGRLFSLVGMVEYAGLLIGLPLMSGFYAATVHIFSGLAYFFTAAFSLLAAILVLFVVVSTVRQQRQHLPNLPASL